MMNQLITAKWYANKATKALAQGDMKAAQAAWETAMERFAEYHQSTKQEVEDVA